MKKLISVKDLSVTDIETIFSISDESEKIQFDPDRNLSAGYSFEGNSIRTRSTFLKALYDLNIHPIEIPNLLKTSESSEHLAGYLDQWFDIFIIRDSDHQKLASFAQYSAKPVINAMTSEEHPCEVLADAYSIKTNKNELSELLFVIIGVPTNVLKSWIYLAEILDLHLTIISPIEYTSEKKDKYISYTTDKIEGLKNADVILTDAWPDGFNDKYYQLTLEDMTEVKSDAWVIPCPPFNINNEINADVIGSNYFAGYEQKKYLYQVHKAVIWNMLNNQ